MKVDKSDENVLAQKIQVGKVMEETLDLNLKYLKNLDWEDEEAAKSEADE